jgi:hypothetical protein
MPDPAVHEVARQILRGLRESLTIAGQVRQPVEVVNAVLRHLQTKCDGCIELTQPYPGEPRIVVTVVNAEALRCRAARPSAADPRGRR